VEWETSPARAARDTVFVWIGGSQVRPAMRPSFPHVCGQLSVDGRPLIELPLGLPEGYTVGDAACQLSFEPRNYISLVEMPHRFFYPNGVTGIYRLKVAGKLLKKGRPLRLRVELPQTDGGYETFFYVSPRRDALATDTATLRQEVLRLQKDLLLLTKSHEMLYAQAYPQFFPKVKGRLVIAHQDDTRHLHPANLTVMADGEIVITMREATDHLARDGRMILVRSRDNGLTWGPREVMYDLGLSDHRSAPLFELPNGGWVTTDYRSGSEYDARGVWGTEQFMKPSLWGAWSTDRGRTWRFSEQPIVVPGNPSQFGEVERHMIRLAGGRLLVAVNFMEHDSHREERLFLNSGIAVFHSDTNGRSWSLLAKVPSHPYAIGEATLLQTRSGKIILLSRTQGCFNEVPGALGLTREWTRRGMLLQSDSHDEGRSWSEFRPTPLCSMNSPGHLLQLQDGRILCTHAARKWPGSIYATVSRDEGATWDTAQTRIVANDLQNSDSCYPNSGQMADGTLITTWYANLFGKFYIPVMIYRPEEL
jgi:hypothetical protein